MCLVPRTRSTRRNREKLATFSTDTPSSNSSKEVSNYQPSYDLSFCCVAVNEIQRDELRSILLNLNIQMSQNVLDDYIEVFATTGGIESPLSDEPFTWTKFEAFFLLVLRNQSGYFREIYNGKRPSEIDIQAHLAAINENVRECFKIYDKDGSGFLSQDEIESCLRDMNFHRQFANHPNPVHSWQRFLHSMWARYDKNTDSKINFEEFIHMYNEILDR